jgi:hypothetical protein
VRQAQPDAAYRRWRPARNRVESEQDPVRLEGFALAHGEEKAPAPADQLADRGLYRTAILGQLVDLRIEWRRQGRASHDAALDEGMEARRQKSRADAIQPRAEITKAHRAEQELADDEERPTLSNDLRGPRQGAELRITYSAHSRDMADALEAVNRRATAVI